MLKKALLLSRRFLFSPARAAKAALAPENLAPCLCIYAAGMLCESLLSALRPPRFLDQAGAILPQSQTWFSALQVLLWQIPLEAALVAFVVGFLAWYKAGRNPWRLFASMAWALGPALLFVLYKTGVGTKAVLGLGSLAALGLFLPLWRRCERHDIMPQVNLMLGINAVYLVILVPMALAVFFRAPDFYIYVAAAGGLWMAALAALALRPLTGLSLPYTFMAILLANLLQTSIIFALHALGLLPKDILKAMLMP